MRFVLPLVAAVAACAPDVPLSSSYAEGEAFVCVTAAIGLNLRYGPSTEFAIATAVPFQTRLRDHGIPSETTPNWRLVSQLSDPSDTRYYAHDDWLEQCGDGERPITPGGGGGPVAADGQTTITTVTHYTVALESNLKLYDDSGDWLEADKACDYPGLTGRCVSKNFLCAGNRDILERHNPRFGGVAMQGTGILEDGTYVRYAGGGTGWTSGYGHWTGCESSRWAITDGARGASGTLLTPHYSIAVDPGVIPLGTSVWIESASQWFRAEDTGGGVTGGHIDIFVGTESWGPVAVPTWAAWTSEERAPGDPPPTR